MAISYEEWIPTVPIVGRLPYQLKRFKGRTGERVIYVRGEYRYDCVQVWSIEAWRVTLTTDATVANRYWRTQWFQEATSDKSTLGYTTSDAVTASSTHTQSQGGYLFSSPADKFGSSLVYGVAPGFFLVSDELTYQFYVSSGVAGDSYDLTVLCRYMNPVLGLKFGNERQKQDIDWSTLRALTHQMGNQGSLLIGRASNSNYV